LSVEPHAVKQGFVLFQMDRNILLHIPPLLCTKTPIDTGACNCSLIKNKLVAWRFRSLFYIFTG